MGWKETYASKLTSMDEAAKVVKSGDTVIIAHAVGEPVALIDKMVDYAVAADPVSYTHLDVYKRQCLPRG